MEVTRRHPNLAHVAEPARVYPWAHAVALMAAARVGDVDKIDAITDELAAIGACRHRRDGSRFVSIAATASAEATEPTATPTQAPAP